MRLATVKEVSEILNVKPSTLYQWAELGQIPCMKLNGCLRFDLEDVAAWVKDCKREEKSGYNSLVQTARSLRKGGQK